MFARIAEFTEAAAQEPLPKRPKLMTPEDVTKLGRYVFEELIELFDTVNDRVDTNITVLKLLAEAMARKKKDNSSNSEVETLAEQQDAIVDLAYYCGDAAAKAGFKLDRPFVIVHNANMAKIDKKTGKVLRRESDGKVLKPEGWTPPDLVPEVERQLRE